jgi:hypothetical protein
LVSLSNELGMSVYSNTSTLAQDLWGMTCGFDVYVSMFWVKLDDLLVGYFGIIEYIYNKERKKEKNLMIIDKLSTK